MLLLRQLASARNTDHAAHCGAQPRVDILIVDAVARRARAANASSSSARTAGTARWQIVVAVTLLEHLLPLALQSHISAAQGLRTVR